MKDFFISYTTADEAWATWIAWHLEQAGYSTVIQAWDFRPGSNFVLEMQRALRECERVIAVLSPRYLASTFTAEEWSAAIASDPIGDKLLPIRIEPCENEGLLRARVYIDLVGVDEATAKQRLLDGVKRGRAKPTTAPPFPQKSGAPAPRFPGALPPIWNVPFPRNPHFTGREDLFTQLRAAPQGVVALVQPQAIHGLGGVGKTQLAVEYAYRYAGDYDLVWWIRADSPTLIATDLALLAAPLQLPERDERDQSIVVRAVLRALAQRNRWLLIFDNAEEPRDVRPFLPQGAGRVLITSRNPVWGALARPLEVQTLPRNEAVEFLLKRIGLPRPPKTGEGWGEGAELADALGCLPLALEQAGAYIETNGITLAEYLRLYRAHQREMLAHPPATDYPASVATTWDISFQAIAAQGRNGIASLQLLNLLAFFAPDPIPRAILQIQRVAEMLGVAVEDDYAFNAVIAPLRRYSLVRIGEEMLTVHRLVQTIVRDRMTEDEGRRFAEAALHCVNDAFPFDVQNDVTAWATCARLYAHARVVTDEAERLQIAPEATARLLNQVAAYLWQRAELSEARQLLERALAIYVATFGPNHPNVATTVNNLGGVLQDLGDLPRAKACYERALAIDEAAFGPNHPNVATRVNNLGSVLRDLGDLPRAKECFERALAIDEAAFGPNHPNVATDVNNLGRVLQDLGDLPRAKAYHERALAIDEAAFGPNHPNVATDVNNLGGVLRDLGDLPRAKECFERVIKIFEDNLGANHPNVATAINNLGGVLHALGDLPRAKACYERALAIDEATFGPNHPNVARDVNNLGGVLHALGDLPRAKACYERALAIDEAAFGPNHPKVATAVNNLGSVLQDLGDLLRAKECYERALAIDEATFGPNHPNVARDVNNLGGVLRDLGDLPRAKECFERALAIDEAAFGPHHPEVAADVNNLGLVLRDLGDLPRAKAYHERALAIDEAVFGPHHPDVARDVNNLGGVLHDLGDLPRAKECYERALAIRETVFGQNHPDVAQSVWWLGVIFQQEGDWANARQSYQRAYQIYRQFLGEDHPTTRNVKGYLDRLDA